MVLQADVAQTLLLLARGPCTIPASSLDPEPALSYRGRGEPAVAL